MIKIEKDKDKIFTLSLNDYLPENTYVKRIKISVNGKMEFHQSKFWMIEDFLWKDGEMRGKIENESDWLTSIVDKNDRTSGTVRKH